MKNIIYIVIVLTSVLSTISCDKTVYNREAKGHVLDATTGLPIKGAIVELATEHGEFLGNSSFDSLASMVTGADGSFEFVYRKKRYDNLILGGYTYEIYAQAQGYFWDPSLDNIWGEGKNLEIKLRPKATLILDVNRVSNAQYVYLSTSSGGAYNCSKTQQYFNHEVEGNHQIGVYYAIFLLNGNIEEHDTSIYCPSFQNTTFRIDY